MALDTTEAPVATVAPPAVPGPAVARHRRRRDLPALAERLWRAPLALAVAIFAACGPAHACGYTDLVFGAVLVALVLAGCAVPLGLVALRHRPAGTDTDG